MATGHVTNKPPERVFSDTERNAKGKLAAAIDCLSRKEPIEVDMTNGQFIRLMALRKERTEDRPLPEWATA